MFARRTNRERNITNLRDIPLRSVLTGDIDPLPFRHGRGVDATGWNVGPLSRI